MAVLSSETPSAARSAVPWSQHRLWTALTYILGLLPLYLLWHGDNAFYLDWKNHLWEISYFGEYFRQHWSFPLTLNTEQLAGIPYPVFYGYLFYPTAGLIGAFTGGSFALRLICSLVFLLQIRQVSKAVETITGNRWLAFTITILVSFATFPLTNLYNRAAIPEFVAASLMLSACMMWLQIVRMENTSRRRRMILETALTLAFAMGTHPITAILGGSMMVLVILATMPFPQRGRDLWRSLGIGATLLAIVIAPWIYAVFYFWGKLQLADGTIFLFSKTSDRLITRFSPIPWDPRIGTPDFEMWGTPYLDTQINLPMLMLALFLVYRIVREGGAGKVREFRIALMGLAGFAVACIASVSAGFWDLIPRSLRLIQFVYRLVTYADLFLLLAVLFLLIGLRRTLLTPDRVSTAVLLVCLAFSARSLNIKLAHAREVEEPNKLAESRWGNSNGDALRSMPSIFYGAAGYAVKTGSRGAADKNLSLPSVSFSTGTGKHFGEVLPLSIPNSAGLLKTNVQIFPWNHLLWNGREIPFAEMTSRNFETVISIQPGAGTLEYFFRPDPVWMALRTLSLWSFLLWFLAFLGWSLLRTLLKNP